jgi:hypothetical protein
MRRTFLTFVVLLFLAAPAAVQAQNYFYYTTNAGALTVVGGYTYSSEVVIPASYNGFPVTGIADQAFEGWCNVQLLAIPGSVTSIGPQAFEGCRALTNLTLGNGLASLGMQAFAECTSLASVTIPGSVTNFGQAVFEGCAGLTNVTISYGVTNIGAGAFSGTGLVHLALPGTVTSIGTNAFASCDGLTSVVIPASVTSIEDDAFAGSGNLAGVYFEGNAPIVGNDVFGVGSATLYYLPGATGWSSTFAGCPAVQAPATAQLLYTTNAGAITITGYFGTGAAVAIPADTNGLPVTGIGGDVFANCINLTNVTLPGSVTRIGPRAFYGCAGLAGMVIPEGVTSIGQEAFEYCAGLTNVAIPASVAQIGHGVLANCSSLAAITVDPANGSFSSVNGVLFDKSQSTLLQYPGGHGVIYTVPASVTSMADEAFAGCASLVNLIVDGGLTNIDSFAFANCAGLANIYFTGFPPNGDFTIFYGDRTAVYFEAEFIGEGGYPFGGLPTTSQFFTFTTDATDTNTITITGTEEFSSAFSIPDSIDGLTVTGIGDGALAGAGFTNLTIPASVTSIGFLAFSSCTNLSSLTILGVVTNFGGGAFYGCTSLTNVSLADGITSIGPPSDPYPNAGLFYNCYNLASINLPASVTNIGPGSFYRCSNLSSIVIPGRVTSIGDQAFYGCARLTNLILPGSVASIGESAFQACNLSSVTIPDSVTNLGITAFSQCDGLTNFILGNGVTSISGGLFSQTGLTSVTIPGTITSIGDEAFAGCASLTNVTIAASVTNIGYSAFSPAIIGLDGLVSFFFLGNAPAVEDGYFAGFNATIYYLPGATGWSSVFYGFPTVVWNPLIQGGGASFGVSNNQFGFNITGTANIPIVVEACANLAGAVWTPLQALTLTNGSYYFSEPLQTNSHGRFYRISSP